MADHSCWQTDTFYLSLFLSSHVISYCSLIGRCLVSNKILILPWPMGISVGCACTRGPDFRGKQHVRFYVWLKDNGQKDNGTFCIKMYIHYFIKYFRFCISLTNLSLPYYNIFSALNSILINTFFGWFETKFDPWFFFFTELNFIFFYFFSIFFRIIFSHYKYFWEFFCYHLIICFSHIHHYIFILNIPYVPTVLMTLPLNKSKMLAMAWLFSRLRVEVTLNWLNSLILQFSN